LAVELLEDLLEDERGDVDVPAVGGALAELVVALASEVDLAILESHEAVVFGDRVVPDDEFAFLGRVDQSHLVVVRLQDGDADSVRTDLPVIEVRATGLGHDEVQAVEFLKSVDLLLGLEEGRVWVLVEEVLQEDLEFLFGWLQVEGDRQGAMVGVDPYALSILGDAVILRVQEFHDHVVTQAREFPDDRLERFTMTICPQALDVFEEDVLGPLGLADSDDVMEQGPAGIVLSLA